jgi:hypothetical protein
VSATDREQLVAIAADRNRPLTDLQAAINAYLAEHNASPRPFVCNPPRTILPKLDRCPVPSV